MYNIKKAVIRMLQHETRKNARIHIHIYADIIRFALEKKLRISIPKLW